MIAASNHHPIQFALKSMNQWRAVIKGASMATFVSPLVLATKDVSVKIYLIRVVPMKSPNKGVGATATRRASAATLKCMAAIPTAGRTAPMGRGQNYAPAAVMAMIDLV